MDWLLINLPIEPIDRRYSAQWFTWFESAFKRNNIPYLTMVGPPVSAPSADKFLDPLGTFIWKYSQLQRAIEVIKERRSSITKFVVFAHDGWMPGLEAFRYIKDLEGINIKVAEWWHAGAYDTTDLLHLRGCNKWAWGSETSWLLLSDVVFTGTHYHKDKLLAHRAFPDNIKVVGYPIEVPSLRYHKRNIVIWPHRLSEDKRPWIFDQLARNPRFKGVEFIKTMDLNLTKSKYYELLASARVAVSTATHENFGIAMLEAAMLGCYPICPDSLSYRETMPSNHLYKNYDEMVGLVARSLAMTSSFVYPYADKYNQINVTNQVCEVLKSL